MAKRGYDNHSASRKVTLITSPYIETHSQLYYVKAYDVNGSQFQICLNYMPPGVALSQIKQGQVWWIERGNTTLWTLSHYVSINGLNLTDEYQAQVQQQINTATRGYQGYQGYQGLQSTVQGPQGYQGYQGYQGTAVSNSAWVSSTSDNNLYFSSTAIASSATVTVGGGFTNYLVLYNGYQGSSQASANGNIYSLSYAASGATISSGGSARGFSYSPDNATNRPAYSDMRILIMSSISSFTLTPYFTMGGINQYGYVSGTQITVVGLS